ncbi:aspartate/glutamate racemase family protein [Arthrobacter sp. ISL-28]|uniref:aspartate/glutamate racemase family protein n=1 Tax=Arthrobacter sp. ISL-28 TaxID=2819108 RepID=UPI001BE68D90|nr:amino acid racemase [Arthrobacter sp. ISL-28]MBT2519437.1 amino acid racemase [Arthrobacter sp. ISL-28]
MMHPQEQVIGILGGMGPAATADFYTKLVGRTQARRDQDHPCTVIWSDPTIPDRTQAILGLGEDPTPWMLRGVRHLEDAGATLIAVPCNTAHAFVPALQAKTNVPILHMIEETVELLFAAGIRKVGLLATTGTCRMGLYQGFADARGLQVLVPDSTVQEKVMEGILKIKGGNASSEVGRRLAGAAARLQTQGAQAVIAGCTEIPLALSQEMLRIPLIDPTGVLADAALRQSGFPLQGPGPETGSAVLRM